VSASGHPDDQAAGVAKEITPQELAAAEVAKRGVVAEPEAKPTEAEQPAVDAATDPAPDKPDAEDDDGIVIPEGLPGYARREIAKIRKQARDRVAAALATAKKEAGPEEWQRIYEANRDEIVAKAQGEVAKAAKEAKEARETAEAAQRERDELRAKAEPPPDPRPARDQFDDPDTYDNALVEWGKRESARVAAAEKAATDREAETKRAAEAKAEHEAAVLKINEGWVAARTKAVEKYPDYAEVAEADPANGGPTITEAMAAAIVQIDNGPDVAYHLGQNVEESERIAAIPNPVRQFIEIGRLAERLATPVRPVRRARPVEHVDTTPTPSDTTEAEPDMAAYAAKRLPELQKNYRPFFPPGGVH
jgi:colicin import membrane protein